MRVRKQTSTCRSLWMISVLTCVPTKNCSSSQILIFFVVIEKWMLKLGEEKKAEEAPVPKKLWFSQWHFISWLTMTLRFREVWGTWVDLTFSVYHPIYACFSKSFFIATFSNGSRHFSTTLSVFPLQNDSGSKAETYSFWLWLYVIHGRQWTIV